MAKSVKSRYLIGLVLAAVLAAGLLALMRPAHAGQQDDTEKQDVDLQITQSAPTKVMMGKNIVYKLKVSRAGTGDNSPVRAEVKDILPSGLVPISVNSSISNSSSDGPSDSENFACSMSNTVTCDTNKFHPKDTATITIVAKAKKAGMKMNEATVETAGDPDPKNDTSKAYTKVLKKKK